MTSTCWSPGRGRAIAVSMLRACCCSRMAAFSRPLKARQMHCARCGHPFSKMIRHNQIEVLSEHFRKRAAVFRTGICCLMAAFDANHRRTGLEPAAPPAVAEHVERLVELSLNADDLALNACIASFADQGWTSDAILSLLIEPAARALGDAWLDDRCSEIDLTIGLSMLQLAGHAVRYSTSTQNHPQQPIPDPVGHRARRKAHAGNHASGRPVSGRRVAGRSGISRKRGSSDQPDERPASRCRRHRTFRCFYCASTPSPSCAAPSSIVVRWRANIPLSSRSAGACFAEARRHGDVPSGLTMHEKSLAGTSVRIAELVQQSRSH